MLRFDINELRDITIIGAIKEMENQKCNFFYDETNNNRKFLLEKENFNSPIDENFVVGGVMYFGENTNSKVDELKDLVKLQKSAKELKFKHVANNKKFLECLETRKVNIFLKWLYESDLYVHFSNVHNLYYALVDIVDSVLDDIDVQIHGIDGIRSIKSELFVFMKNNYHEAYKLLYENNYPNIEDDNIGNFCEELLQMIEKQDKISFGLECFKQFLNKGKHKKELIFLKGNPERIILNNYVNFYLRQVYTFKNAFHIFDRECEIEKALENIELYDGEEKLSNYIFVESENNSLVQVSDVVVGLLGKYFEFINRFEMKDILDLENNLTDFQKETLSLFARIILKSEKKCFILLHSCVSLHDYVKSAKVMEIGINIAKKKIIQDFINKYK